MKVSLINCSTSRVTEGLLSTSSFLANDPIGKRWFKATLQSKQAHNWFGKTQNTIKDTHQILQYFALPISVNE
jgi:hypothetical protein